MLTSKGNVKLLYCTRRFLVSPEFVMQARAALGLAPLAPLVDNGGAAPLAQTTSNSGESASSSAKAMVSKDAVLCVIDNNVPTGEPTVKVVRLATNPIPTGRETDFNAYLELIHDLGAIPYADRLAVVDKLSDLGMNTEEVYAKVQAALRYLKDKQNGFKICGKARVDAHNGYERANAGAVDFENAILRPMSPGDELALKNGRIIVVVWSRKNPTYYDLSLAGKREGLTAPFFNLTFDNTGKAEHSLAKGSGDQVGHWDGESRLVHEFEFLPAMFAPERRRQL